MAWFRSRDYILWQNQTPCRLIAAALRASKEALLPHIRQLPAGRVLARHYKPQGGCAERCICQENSISSPTPNPEALIPEDPATAERFEKPDGPHYWAIRWK